MALAYRESPEIVDMSQTHPTFQNIENVVLKQARIKASGAEKASYTDLGKYCYSSYEVKPHEGNKGAKVDIKTLIDDRKPLVESLFNLLRGMNKIAPQSYMFISWLFSNQNTAGYTDNVLETALYNYAVALNEQIRSGTKSFNTAKNYRPHATKLVAEHLGKTTKELVLALPKIAGKRSSPEAVGYDQFSQFVQTLCAFFWHGTEALMKRPEEPFPFCLDLRDIYDEKQAPVWHRGVTKLSKQPNLLLVESGYDKLLTLDEAKAACKKAGLPNTVKSDSYKECFVDLILKSNLPYSKARHALASQCLVAYYLIFTSQAALNAGVAENLVEFESAEFTAEGEHEGKAPLGQTFTGTKVRAGNKTVYPTIPKAYLPYHNRYNEFVEWVLKHYQLTKPNTVFFELNAPYKPSVQVGEVRLDSLSHDRHERNVAPLKRFLTNRVPDLRWMTPRELRKAHGNVRHPIDPNPQGVARKLGNDIKTTLRHYTGTAREEGQLEISQFFNGLHDHAVERARKDRDEIPVRIVDELTSVTEAGGCEAQEGDTHKLAEGFTEAAPQPDCTNPKTCFFCEHYSVHAADDDIHNILSIRKLISVAKTPGQARGADVILDAPIEDRIDEILSLMIKNNPNPNFDIEARITAIQKDVEDGNLSTAWQPIYDMHVGLSEVKAS